MTGWTPNKTYKVTWKDARPILAKSFPGYSGRKIKVELAEKVYVHDTNWGDGTRNKYAALQVDGSFSVFDPPTPWRNMEEGKTVDMQPGMMIVEHSIFCGKDVGITIYIHPANAPKWLT